MACTLAGAAGTTGSIAIASVSAARQADVLAASIAEGVYKGAKPFGK
jgi:hypothetical protein